MSYDNHHEFIYPGKIIMAADKERFDKFVNRLLGHEGRYVNDPEDPGGETNWGISKREYPHLNIKELTREQAVDIYYEDFWSVLPDILEDGPTFQLFDFAVNSGIGTAIRQLQRAVGVADDGNIGPVTRSAIQQISESDLILRIVAQRLEYMTKLKNWSDHGKGWVRRMAQNLRYGAEDSD